MARELLTDSYRAEPGRKREPTPPRLFFRRVRTKEPSRLGADRKHLPSVEPAERLAHGPGPIGRREKDDAAASPRAAGLSAPRSGLAGASDRPLDRGGRHDRGGLPTGLPLGVERAA